MNKIRKNIMLDEKLDAWAMAEANKLGLTFSSYVRMMLIKAMNDSNLKKYGGKNAGY